MRFCQGGVLACLLGKCNDGRLVRYLDSLNREELYWPRTTTLTSGSKLKPELEFTSTKYSEWRLYCIERTSICQKDAGSRETSLRGIMSGDKNLHKE